MEYHSVCFFYKELSTQYRPNPSHYYVSPPPPPPHEGMDRTEAHRRMDASSEGRII